ncbi:MAG: hypothetical protein Q4C41_02020 [Eggerthellaceae bacterium]|nr:hypothetical protein [Eggerthellaceae bacterium]MDO5385453.1 hypothetical protein [Rikenellaceae bacterium]
MFNAADTQLYAYLLGIEDGLPDALGYTQVAVPLLMMAFLFMRFVMNTAKLTKDARVAAFAAKPAARFAQAALLWVSSVGFALSVTLHVLARIIVVLNERLIGIPFYDEYPFGCAQEDTAELLAVVLFSIVVCTVVCAVFGSLRCKPNKRGRIRRAANALRMRPTARWVMLTAAVTTSAITVPAAIAALVVAAALALSVAVMILGLALAVVLLPLMIPLCFAAMRNA